MNSKPNKHIKAQGSAVYSIWTLLTWQKYDSYMPLFSNVTQ